LEFSSRTSLLKQPSPTFLNMGALTRFRPSLYFPFAEPKQQLRNFTPATHPDSNCPSPHITYGQLRAKKAFSDAICPIVLLLRAEFWSERIRQCSNLKNRDFLQMPIRTFICRRETHGDHSHRRWPMSSFRNMWEREGSGKPQLILSLAKSL